LVTISSGV